MLTCEQNLTESRRIAAGRPITKETYYAIASAIHQTTKAPLLGDLPDDERRQLNAALQRWLDSRNG